MKVYGKKTVIIDCEWELEDQPDLREKLESMKNYELIEFLFFSSGKVTQRTFVLGFNSKKSA